MFIRGERQDLGFGGTDSFEHGTVLPFLVARRRVHRKTVLPPERPRPLYLLPARMHVPHVAVLVFLAARCAQLSADSLCSSFYRLAVLSFRLTRCARLFSRSLGSTVG